MPKHSIVMTTYNRSHLILRSIRSVLAQLETDWELIVVLDGCTDNTDEVVARYHDPRIKMVVRKENSADEGNRIGRAIEPTNDGLRVVQGHYISHLDDDDIYLPLRLKRAGDELDWSRKLDAVYCDSLVHYQLNGKEMCKLMFSKDFDAKRLMERNYIRTPEMTYRRDVLRKVGAWELKCPMADGKTIKPKRHGRVASDWWYWKKMLTKLPDLKVKHLQFADVEVFSWTSALYNDVAYAPQEITEEMITPEWCGQTGDPKEFKVEEFYDGADWSESIASQIADKVAEQRAMLKERFAGRDVSNPSADSDVMPTCREDCHADN